MSLHQNFIFKRFLNTHILAFLFLLLPFQLVHAASFESLSDDYPPISGRSVIAGEIKPSDVLSRLTWLEEELNAIKVELGIKTKAYETIETIGGTPQDVYFMIYRLYEKVNRLSFQFVNADEEIHSIDASLDYDTQILHNFLLATETLKQIHIIKQWLKIPEVIEEKSSPNSTTTEQVNRAAIKLHSIVDRLLIKKIAPADVYQEITIVINITAQLLAAMDAPLFIPEAAEFERKKTPTDVYAQLAKAFNLLEDIARLSGKTIIQLGHSVLENDIVEPTHVQMLATLLHAELLAFHENLKTANKPANAYYPGFKTPSHVYQRSTILVAQLEMLKDLVKKKPDWLQIK